MNQTQPLVAWIARGSPSQMGVLGVDLGLQISQLRNNSSLWPFTHSTWNFLRVLNQQMCNIDGSKRTDYHIGIVGE